MMIKRNWQLMYVILVAVGLEVTHYTGPSALNGLFVLMIFGYIIFVCAADLKRWWSRER
jgi:hypothetical protein